MINFYYADPTSKTQYFVNVDSIENISEVKIKNAIAKEAVKGLVSRIGNVSAEDQKTLTKRLKTSTYVGSLIEGAGYTNIEITGDFTKVVAKMENIEIIENGTLKTVEAEKLNNKVLENVYIVKDGSFYNVYYKRIFLFNSKTKSDIINKLNENTDRIEKHVENMLVKFRFQAPTTQDQLNTYRDELISDIEYTQSRIDRMISKNKDQDYIDIKVNELNALKDELKLVESMLNNNVEGVKAVDTYNNNIPVDANNPKNADTIIYNTCYINNTAEYKEIVKQIKTLDNYIDILEDKRIQLSNYIRNELNIECNYHLHIDIKECREYIELNTLMDNKELELDQLIEKRKLIATNNYNKYKDNLITAYGSNKYRIVYNNRIEFSNNIEPFKALECNVSIFTLINNKTSFIEVLVYKKEYDNKLYNSAYNRTCKLESIYNYEVNKCLLLDEIIKVDNEIIRQVSDRYDNSNNNIYHLIYWNDRNYIVYYVNIKSNFMITYQVLNGLESDRTYYNLSLLKSVQGIPLEYYEYINKVNDKLNNNIGLKLVG